MTGHPRRNEPRAYRYPMRRMVGTLTDAQLDEALQRLGDAGVDLDQVNVLSGEKGKHLLDVSGDRGGWRGRLLRWLQSGAFEGETLNVHAQMLALGEHVIYVPVKTDEQRSRVEAALRASGAQNLVFFRRWSIESLPR